MFVDEIIMYVHGQQKTACKHKKVATLEGREGQGDAEIRSQVRVYKTTIKIIACCEKLRSIKLP